MGVNAKLSIEIVLLTGAVGLELVCAIAILLVHDPFDRLHFLGPTTSIGPALIALAIVMEEALSTNGVKAIVVAVLLLITSPVLTHATARAARVRQYGHWQAISAEEVDSD